MTTALLGELERGNLMREEELLILDLLITDALLHGDPRLRPRLDEWSQRALEMAPEIATLHGSRGAALVELGRLAEGKALLEPLLTTDRASYDALLSHIFLARAEGALGNVERARYLATQARAIASAHTFPSPVMRLVELLEAEGENTEQSTV